MIENAILEYNNNERENKMGSMDYYPQGTRLSDFPDTTVYEWEATCPQCDETTEQYEDVVMGRYVEVTNLCNECGHEWEEELDLSQD